MATERLAMHQAREILRQKLVLKRSHRAVMTAVGVSMGTVSGVVVRATALGLDWEAVEALDDDALEERLYGPRCTTRDVRPLPDAAALHVELRRPGVTLAAAARRVPASSTRAATATRSSASSTGPWLEQRGLDRCARTTWPATRCSSTTRGRSRAIVDVKTGERIEVELFVAVLGASNYTYAEATCTQRVPDFVASHGRAFEFFGGVPAAIVPDQLKSAVVTACRSTSPGCSARTRTWRSTTAPRSCPRGPASRATRRRSRSRSRSSSAGSSRAMRNQTFFSLDELNARIARAARRAQRPRDAAL